MSLKPGTLKLAGGVGALLVCGGAGLTVAADQRPASAPLHPPVGEGGGAAATPAADAGLVIPPTPVCSSRAAAAAARRGRAGPGAALSCRGGDPGTPGNTTSITPSVSDAAGSGAPLTYSYVS